MKPHNHGLTGVGLLLTTLLLACQSSPTTTQSTDKAAPTDAVTTTAPAQAVGVNNPPAPVNDFLIVPGKRVGPITAKTSEADLLRMLGPSVVTAGDSLYGAEGSEYVGTTLYKGTADEVQITYDDEERTRPSSVMIRPEFVDNEGKPILNMAPGRWTTAGGVRIGTTLKELERYNGKSFKLWGFEWDYGGLVAGWQGGKLTPPDTNNFLSMSLSSPIIMTTAQQKAYNQVLGDGEFLSSSAAMQRLNPTVARLDTAFP